MSAVEWIVVIAGVVAVVALVAWFFAARKFPERAATHGEERPFEDESGRGAQPGRVVERPAGPGVDDERPDGRGPLRPGP